MTTNHQILKGRNHEYQLLTPISQTNKLVLKLARRMDVGSFERFVLYKQLKSELTGSEGHVKLFARKARISALFNQTSLVRTLEFGKAMNAYFMISEYLPGDSLGFYLSNALDGPIAPRLAACLAVQACDALEFAHKLKGPKGEEIGLVHRAINLKNLILLPRGKLKVTNFVMGRQSDSSLTIEDLAYFSPEQCSGQPIGPSSDIFSLGVVLWELMTRHHLFAASDEAETKKAITTNPTPSPREVQEHIDLPLEKIVLQALNKDPQARFESAGQMSQALRDYLGYDSDDNVAEELKDLAKDLSRSRFLTKIDMLEKIEKTETDSQVDDIQIDKGILIPATDYSLPLFDHTSAKLELDLAHKEAVPGLPKEEEEEEEVATSQPEFIKLPEPQEEEPESEKIVPKQKTEPFFNKLKGLLYPLLQDPKYRLIASGVAVSLILLVVVILVWPSGTDEFKKEAAKKIQAQQAEIDRLKALQSLAVKEKPKPKKLTMARLEIDSDPAGCKVELDGLNLDGRTPLKNVIIPAEIKHEIEVSCKGFEAETKTIVADSKEKLRLEFFPPPFGAKDNKTPGRLQLVTNPKTWVYFGKRKLGPTPLLGVSLPAGKHNLRLVNKEKRIDQTLEVVIESDKTTNLQQDF
jgi:serine/threonine-protein kinase